MAGIRCLAVHCASSVIWSLVLLSPVWFLPDVLVRLAAPALPGATDRLASELIGWLGLYVLLLNLVYVLSAVFHVFNHFRLPAATELAFNIVVIGIFMVFAPLWGIRALVLGSLVGITFCVLLLTGALLRSTRDALLGTLHPTELLLPVMPCLPMAAYYLASQFPGLLANYFASGLGEGSIAAFAYARTILAAAITLVTLSLARAVFPTFASLFADGRMEEFRQLIIGLAKLILFVFLPLSMFALLYREPVLRLLYQRGAFDETALQLTATAFGFLALGLVFAAWEPVGTRALYAVGDTQTPLLSTLGSASVVLPLCLLLTPALGLAGVAVSLSLAFALDSAVQVFSLGRRLESPIWKELGWFSAKCGVCAVVSGTLLLALPVKELWAVLVGGFLYLCSYGLLVRGFVQSIRSIVTVTVAR